MCKNKSVLAAQYHNNHVTIYCILIIQYDVTVLRRKVLYRLKVYMNKITREQQFFGA